MDLETQVNFAMTTLAQIHDLRNNQPRRWKEQIKEYEKNLKDGQEKVNQHNAQILNLRRVMNDKTAA